MRPRPGALVDHVRKQEPNDGAAWPVMLIAYASAENAAIVQLSMN